MSAEVGEYKGSALFYGFIRNSLFLCYRVFFCFRSFGSKKVPSSTDRRGVILATNHASFLDPPILGISLKRRVTFLAKDYLFKNFWIGAVLRGIGAYPIKSEKDDFRSIRELIRILKEGKCVVVFPEGTRSSTGQMKEPESGIGFLAVKSQSYVVPAYIRGSFDAYPKGARFFRLRPVQIFYGDPFIPGSTEKILSNPDPYGATAREIMNRIAQIKRDVESGTYDNFPGSV